jgi:ribosome-binding ATPase YchF (GTP1/OBG family)
MLQGGTTVAGWEVNAKEIGAKSGVPTEIEVGEDPRLRDEMRRIEKESKSFMEQLDKTKKGDLEIMLKVQQVLKDGQQIRCAQWNNKEIDFLNTLQLLTAKPAMLMEEKKARRRMLRRARRTWHP